MSKVLVLPDVQAKPGDDFTFLNKIGRYLVEKKPDTVVCLGDFADMPSLSSYDVGKKSFEGRRYLADIEAAKDAMCAFLSPLWEFNAKAKKNKEKQYHPRMVMTLGNHCLPPDTEVLTYTGWVPITEVTEEMSVASMDSNRKLKWDSPLSLVCVPHDDVLYSWNGAGSSITCTPNHRMYYTGSEKKVFVKLAKDMPSSFDIISSISTDEEYSLTNEQLKLAAWFCTDSHFISGKQVVLYQRESNANKIEELLTSLGVSFTKRVRIRDIKVICGKTLKVPPENGVEFYMSKQTAHSLGVFSNTELPSWCHHLSQNQWDIFLETLIEADGSIPTRATDSRVFYGKKKICDSLQQYAVTHGWSASLSEYRPTHWRVNLCKRQTRRQESKNLTLENYTGLVYCLEMPESNFVIRQNNKVHVTGNCERIKRAVENDPKLEGVLSIDALGYEAFGWEVVPFLDVIVVDGVAYSHYFVTGLMGRPVTSAAACLTKKHQSCIQGHQQGLQIATGYKADGSLLTSIIAGSCYEHDEPYMNQQSNNHWRGFLMLHAVKDGSFDLMPVSLAYINKKYAD